MNTFWVGLGIWEMYIFYYAGIPVNLAAMLFSISRINTKFSKLVIYIAVLLNLVTVPFIMWSAIIRRDNMMGHPVPVFEIVLVLFLLVLTACYLIRVIKKAERAKMH